MKLTQSNIISIAIYSVLFVLSSLCNLTMISYLCCKANVLNKSRMNRFMLHLTIADLMITFLTIPMEIGWKWTVYWRAGNVGCKFFQFIRPIGNYLASFIIISLSLDRYEFNFFSVSKHLYLSSISPSIVGSYFIVNIEKVRIFCLIAF